MRKHLFLGLFLPFILVLTAIGTGFAVFFFGENQTKNNMDELVVVDNKVDSSFGTLFLAYGYEDNENFIDYNISGGDNHFDPFAYITQTTIDFPSPIRTKFVFKNKESKDETYGYYSRFQYTFHYEITISEVFAYYFRLFYPAISDESSRTVTGLLSNPEDTSKKTENIVFDETTVKYEDGAYTFQQEMILPIIIAYRSGAIPTSTKAFTDMWDKIKDSAQPLLKLAFYLTVTPVIQE